MFADFWQIEMNELTQIVQRQRRQKLIERQFDEKTQRRKNKLPHVLPI